MSNIYVRILSYLLEIWRTYVLIVYFNKHFRYFVNIEFRMLQFQYKIINWYIYFALFIRDKIPIRLTIHV